MGQTLSTQTPKEEEPPRELPSPTLQGNEATGEATGHERPVITAEPFQQFQRHEVLMLPMLPRLKLFLNIMKKLPAPPVTRIMASLIKPTPSDASDADDSSDGVHTPPSTGSPSGASATPEEHSVYTAFMDKTIAVLEKYERKTCRLSLGPEEDHSIDMLQLGPQEFCNDLVMLYRDMVNHAYLSTFSQGLSVAQVSKELLADFSQAIESDDVARMESAISAMEDYVKAHGGLSRMGGEEKEEAEGSSGSLFQCAIAMDDSRTSDTDPFGFCLTFGVKALSKELSEGDPVTTEQLREALPSTIAHMEKRLTDLQQLCNVIQVPFDRPILEEHLETLKNDIYRAITVGAQFVLGELQKGAASSQSRASRPQLHKFIDGMIGPFTTGLLQKLEYNIPELREYIGTVLNAIHSECKQVLGKKQVTVKAMMEHFFKHSLYVSGSPALRTLDLAPLFGAVLALLVAPFVASFLFPLLVRIQMLGDKIFNLPPGTVGALTRATPHVPTTLLEKVLNGKGSGTKCLYKLMSKAAAARPSMLTPRGEGRYSIAIAQAVARFAGGK